MDKTDDENPNNRWGALPGEGELHDLDFDFEGFFARDVSDLSEEEQAQWPGRIYAFFCSSFYKSGGDTSKIPKWVAAYVADRLFDGLQGAPWGDTMRLPWDKPTSYLTPKGERAMDIYAQIENGRKDAPERNTTDLIAEAAQAHFVSFETARADYYAMKKGIQFRTGIPKKFLKDEGDF